MHDMDEARRFLQHNLDDVIKRCPRMGRCQACCCDGAACEEDSASLHAGFNREDLLNMLKDGEIGYGCGNGAAIAKIKRGATVLDLGSGGGFDCFLARGQVGPEGKVIGVDMAPAMVRLARNNAKKSGYKNVEFRLGEIEYLPVANASVDVVLSNCVVNMCADKNKVFGEAYRVLKNKGRLCLCDFLLIAPLPKKLREELNQLIGCMDGVVLVETMRAKLRGAGFTDISIRPKESGCLCTWLPGKNIEHYMEPFSIEAIKYER